MGWKDGDNFLETLLVIFNPGSYFLYAWTEKEEFKPWQRHVPALEAMPAHLLNMIPLPYHDSDSSRRGPKRKALLN